MANGRSSHFVVRASRPHDSTVVYEVRPRRPHHNPLSNALPFVGHASRVPTTRCCAWCGRSEMASGRSSHFVVRASRPHEHSENATPVSFRPSELRERAEEPMELGRSALSPHTIDLSARARWALGRDDTSVVIDGPPSRQGWCYRIAPLVISTEKAKDARPPVSFRPSERSDRAYPVSIRPSELRERAEEPMERTENPKSQFRNPKSTSRRAK